MKHEMNLSSTIGGITKNKKVYLALLMITVLCFIAACGSAPSVTKQNMEEASKIVEDNAEVLDAAVGMEEDDLIYCAILVEDFLTEEEKISVGENCAKVLNAIVYEKSTDELSEGNLGDLYDHYTL